MATRMKAVLLIQVPVTLHRDDPSAMANLQGERETIKAAIADWGNFLDVDIDYSGIDVKVGQYATGTVGIVHGSEGSRTRVG